MIGNLLDFNSVRAALSGVKRAYFNFPIGPGLVQATAQFVRAAQEADLEAIVNMSQKIAREDAASHAAFDHWLSERIFDWAGIGVTHLRPTFFAEWLLYFSAMIRQGTIYAPYDTLKAALNAAEDQGRVIANILQNPEPHRGKIYPRYGPVEYTFPEITEIVSRILDRKIACQKVPFNMMRDAFAAGGENANAGRNDAFSGYSEVNPPDSNGESHASQHLRQALLDHDNGLFSGTNDLVEQITGRAPITIEEFVLEHRTVFTPA